MDDADVASWVLLAIGATAQKPDAPLDLVVGAADAINHAVLRHDELELAVQILEGAGLVSATGPVLRLTDAGRSELQHAESRYWHESWAKLRNRLERLGIEERSSWRIEPRQFRAAIDTYLARMAPKPRPPTDS